MDDKVREKIKALLRLTTDNGASEAEMQTAMSMAMKLAARHRLNIHELKEEAQNQEEKEEAFTKAEFRTAEGEFRRPPSDRNIVPILTRFFGVEIIYTYPASRLIFIGRESDVEFAQFAYNFLRVTYNRLWKEYKHQRGCPQSFRASFFRGLQDGLFTKLALAERENYKEFARQKSLSDSAFALVVVTEDDKRKAASAEFVPNTEEKKFKARPLLSCNAYETGKSEGMKINVARGLNNVTEKLK